MFKNHKKAYKVYFVCFDEWLEQRRVSPLSTDFVNTNLNLQNIAQLNLNKNLIIFSRK